MKNNIIVYTLITLAIMQNCLHASVQEIVDHEIAEIDKPVAEHRHLPDTNIVTCLDGGGQRAIVTITIMAAVEEQMSGIRIQDACNIFAGTSSGGLIASAMALSDFKEYQGRNMIDVVRNIYQNEGHRIFNASWFSKFIGSYIYPEYTVRGLVGVLKEYMFDYKLGDLKKTLILPSVDTNRAAPIGAAPFIMNSQDKNLQNMLVRHACQAATAAPTFFPAFSGLFNQDENRQRELVDGGIIWNHPGQVAIAEICKNYSNFDPIDVQKTIRMVSFGTGSFGIPVQTSRRDSMGIVEWMPAISSTMSGASEIFAHESLAVTLGPNRYTRLGPVSDKSYAMDDISPEVLITYRDIGLFYVKQHPWEVTNTARTYTHQKIMDR